MAGRHIVPMSTTPRVRSRRADAIRNESLVRAAAERVFTRKGQAILMEDVAAEAGVSKGTVYNVFASRDGMVEILTVAALKVAAADYRAAAGAADLWGALTAAILTPTLGLSASAQLMDPAAPRTPARLALEEAMAALNALLDTAKAAGVVRPEIQVGHLTTLFCGLYGVLPNYDARAPGEALAYADIILRGIRT